MFQERVAKEYEMENEMALKLVVEFSDADLAHYREVLQAAWQRGAKREEAELVGAAGGLLEKVRASGLSGAVRKRLEDLGALIAMLEDREWALEGEDRDRILYFADPLDLIPDNVPGLGYLDDALMAELILRELRNELEAYQDFCRYRKEQEQRRGETAHIGRDRWLAAKRRQLFSRMNRRRADRHRHGSNDSLTPPILQYRS
jgi:uncharacterized membrane protein YkvA (DUF1232 family)